MRISKLISPFALGMVMLAGTNASAVVISSLPKAPPTPDEWTESTFGGTTLTNNGRSVTLTTVPGQGEWFGWGTGYTDPKPAWDLGSSADGNRLGFTAHFSADARDWSSYLHDGNYQAFMEFKPTGCDYTLTPCYDAPFVNGVGLSFATAFNSSVALGVFVPLADMTIDHKFGYFLKDGLVSYVIDGAHYSGYAQSSGARILVTGDGSGSSPTTTGSMTLRNIAIDTAPRGAVALGAVPEPATWGLMFCGFGMIGSALRRARSGQAIRRSA